MRLMLVLALLFGICAASDAGATRCLTRELDPYRALVRDVPPEQMIRTHTGDHPMTPPADPDVGDSWIWYTWNLHGMPVAEPKMCTVRGEGTNVYIVVEDSQWLTNVTQADVDRMVNFWDHQSLGQFPDKGIYELDTTNFGPAPDELDNDPKIYVLYYDLGVADGFFWPFDQYPDGSQPWASNECEVLYMNSTGSPPGGDFMISVQAHEFEHMIHWLADEGEVAWVDEGMAELAMWIFGHPDPITGFPSQPDNSLTDFNGWADYIQSYLWSLYFYEQFGGQAATWRVLHEPADSIQGYENVLDQLGSPLNVIDVFANWTCANFLDDTTLDRGQYGYRGATMPPFASTTKSTYPVGPTNGTVLGYATDYVKFINGVPQLLSFDGTDIGTWCPRVMFLDGGVAKHVAVLPLDAVDAGSRPLYGFGTDYDTVVLAINKTTPTSGTSYTYQTSNPNPADVLGGGDARAFSLQPLPNPMVGAGTVALSIPQAQEVRVEVLDPAGRVVRTLARGAFDAGSAVVAWDGRMQSGASAPAGVYLVRATTASGVSTTARWTRLR